MPNNQTNRLETQANSILTVTLLVTLISVSGIALPYPLLAPLFDAGTSPLTHFMSIPKQILFGIVIGIYPLGLIIGSSLIGAFSDQHGRRKVLIFTMLGSSLSYILTAYAVISGNFLLFCLSRFITGLLEGNISIARAIATDLHPTIDKTKSLSWISAMGFGGYLIGPLVGGQLAYLGTEVVFYWASAACLAATLLCYFQLPPSLDRKAHNAETGSSLNLLKDIALRRFFFIYFLLMLGINTYYEFYPLWLVEKLSYTPKDIGWATVFITSCMITSSVLINPRIRNKMTTAQASLLGMVIVGLSLVLVPYLGAQSFLIGFGLIGAGVGIYNGFLSSYLSTAYEHRAQGKLMGMLVTVFCVGNLAAAGLGSAISLIEVDYTLFASGFCVVVASSLFFLGHFKFSLWEK
ncbi:MFS transporter [Parashewanella spongiae]|uniref:MFS transporter n=1 Tax=Parashewanella spongiae TaxID=342950 RepID=A0A3A6UCE4_9GAMM|nr:MFS transporter [Parashewanella spongiae]MCL1078205.1 MFS transporter [Parashewanella spongiae]RJY16400.1 MFS transporter [Parashewanella spongiae]